MSTPIRRNSQLVSGTLSPFLEGAAAGRLPAQVPGVCATWESLSAADDLSAPHDELLKARVIRAVTLFRFGRSQEASRKLDTAVDMVNQIVDSRVSPEQRQTAITRIQRLQACLRETKLPAMATIIVRPLSRTDDNGKRLDDRPIPAVHVRVEDLPVGETGRSGTLRVRVPSGAITLEAAIPPSLSGVREITLAPGTTTTVRVQLYDVETVSEASVMTLAEAVEGVVPAGTRSLTFRFATDDHPVQIVSLALVELYDSDGELVDELTDLFDFGVNGDGIIASDAPSLVKRLGRDGKAVTLQVIAGDADGFGHHGRFTFRIR